MEGGPVRKRVYYDSVLFMEVTVGGRRTASCLDMFRRIRDGPYDAVISQVVVGETHAVVMRRYRDPWELRKRVLMPTDAFVESGADPSRGIVPIDPDKVCGIALDLARLDDDLAGTDTVIPAIALADPYSTRLFTWDGVLVRSEKVAAYEKKMRRKKLRACRLLITHAL